MVHFLEHISVKTNYLQELKAFAPYDHLDDFITVLNTIKDEKDLEEISSILVAYCNDQSNIEIRWFFFMQLFCKRVPMLKVRCEKGNIKSVNKDSRIDLDNYVTSILHRTSKAYVKFKIKPRKDKPSKYRTYTKQEASSLAQMKKSYYLEELCKMQLPAYKVYHFTESRANVTSFASEDIFCFVLKETENNLVIAIENTLDSRSTILFYVKKDELPRALDVINVFFASSTLNKRQSLQWKAVDFNDPSIIRYERIIHTSFGEWKGVINHHVY